MELEIKKNSMYMFQNSMFIFEFQESFTTCKWSLMHMAYIKKVVVYDPKN